jgi:hypothetical protein
MHYKRRILHDLLATRPTKFRAVLITGPRRSGKSTLTRKLLQEWGGDPNNVLQFDTPTDQARFSADPEGLLRSYRPPIVLDEVQNVPLLFSYLKKLTDENLAASCD